MTASVQFVTNQLYVYTLLCVYIINMLMRTRLEPGRLVYTSVYEVVEWILQFIELFYLI